MPHFLDQALGPHIGPVLLDEVKARRARVLRMRDGPACWYLGEGRPERVLPLIVDQGKKPAVLVLEWIGHVLLLYADRNRSPLASATPRPLRWLMTNQAMPVSVITTAMKKFSRRPRKWAEE